MISIERKKEIIAEIEYSVNRIIDKQCVVSDAIDDLLTKEEKEWFQEACFGKYLFRMWRLNNVRKTDLR